MFNPFVDVEEAEDDSRSFSFYSNPIAAYTPTAGRGRGPVSSPTTPQPFGKASSQRVPSTAPAPWAGPSPRPQAGVSPRPPPSLNPRGTPQQSYLHGAPDSQAGRGYSGRNSGPHNPYDYPGPPSAGPSPYANQGYETTPSNVGFGTSPPPDMQRYGKTPRMGQYPGGQLTPSEGPAMAHASTSSPWAPSTAPQGSNWGSHGRGLGSRGDFSATPSGNHWAGQQSKQWGQEAYKGTPGGDSSRGRGGRGGYSNHGRGHSRGRHNGDQGDGGDLNYYRQFYKPSFSQDPWVNTTPRSPHPSGPRGGGGGRTPATAMKPVSSTPQRTPEDGVNIRAGRSLADVFSSSYEEAIAGGEKTSTTEGAEHDRPWH